MDLSPLSHLTYHHHHYYSLSREKCPSFDHDDLFHEILSAFKKIALS